MKIKIISYKDSSYWYAQHVGETFNVICYYPEDEVFLVRERAGFLNIVHKNCCEVLKDDER